jgi:hypothetical protein
MQAFACITFARLQGLSMPAVGNLLPLQSQDMNGLAAFWCSGAGVSHVAGNIMGRKPQKCPDSERILRQGQARSAGRKSATGIYLMFLSADRLMRCSYADVSQRCAMDKRTRYDRAGFVFFVTAITSRPAQRSVSFTPLKSDSALDGIRR